MTQSSGAVLSVYDANNVPATMLATDSGLPRLYIFDVGYQETGKISEAAIDGHTTYGGPLVQGEIEVDPTTPNAVVTNNGDAWAEAQAATRGKS